jgi:Zn-dependent protease/predicted transcriptional regulator
MRSGFRLARVFGIQIRIDWSWLLILLLVTWSLGSSFGQAHPTWTAGVVWGTALFAALLFFTSVVLHELAHSLVARARGIPVQSITLFLFGGVSSIQHDPDSPGAEFVMAIVGPLTSLVLGAILLVVAAPHVRTIAGSSSALQGLSLLSPLPTILLWLGTINVALGVFNMIPGFPLDGGRVLRSILWGISGNLRRATRWASWIGQAIAWLLIATGIAMIFGVQIPYFGTGLLNGLWLAFIGWFLNNASSQSYRQIVVHDILEGVSVERMMRTDPPTVPPDSSVSSLVHDHVMGTDEAGFPVVEGDQLVGIVTIDDIRAIPRDEWETTTVRDIMTPFEKLVTVGPKDDGAVALDRLTENDVRQLPVVEGHSLVGLLRRRDVMQWLRAHADRFRE